MPNDKIDQAKRTTKGATEKHTEATNNLSDAAEEAVNKTGAVDNLEDERDAIEDDYEETLRSTQSYMDQHGKAMGGVGQQVKALFDQIVMDRRTFLGGMALLGAGYADRSNLLPTDGSYDPLDGQDHNSEEPHDDWDAFGLVGEQGFEPHVAAEGGPDNAEYQVMNESIGREAYQEIFPDIVEDDRAVAQQIMGPDAFDRYFDGQATEFAEMNVNYHPDPEVPDNSKIQLGLVQADEVEDLSNIPEEDISYSGWQNISDRAAQRLIQEADQYN